MSNNLFNDISSSDILLINVLNSMYNDNLRIIHNLIDQNNEIRHHLLHIFNERRGTNRNSSGANNSANNSRNTNTYRRRPNNNDRVYINNIPFIVEEVQFTPETSNLGSQIRSLVNNDFYRLLSSFLEPINIIPTQEQIEIATRNTTYGQIRNPTYGSCPISLENFTDTTPVTMILYCRHIFCTESLMSWFNNNTRCPVCRFDIRTYRENPNNSNSNENQTNQTSNANNSNNVNNTNNTNTENEEINSDSESEES
jgi:hypothetical protein